MHNYLEDLKSLYDDALNAIISLLDEEEESYEKLRDEEKKELEQAKENNEKKIKGINKEIKAIDKEIKALQKSQDAIRDNDIKPLQDIISERQKIVDSINEEVEAMEKANEQRQDAIDLQRLQYEMERSQHQLTNLVYTGDAGSGQMRYRPDESAIRSSREALEDKQEELRIKSKREEAEIIEKEIEDLNKQIDEYEDKISKIDDSISKLEKEKEQLNEQIELLEDQNEVYQEQLDAIDLKYDDLISKVSEYRDSWKEIADYAEKASQYALLSSIGFDPELIKNLDPESLKNFDAIYSSILGSLSANDEEMTNALQNLSGSTLGDYLSSTADGIAALDKLDLSTINAAIKTASDGALAMRDGFDLAAQIIPTISQNLDGVAKSAENATSVIGTAISTEKSSGTGANGQPTLTSSIAEVGETSEQALGEEGVQGDLVGVTEAANIATEEVVGIKSALEELTEGSPYEIEIRVKKTGDEISAHASGTVGNAYADGYPGLPQSELALRSEYGQPELTVYPNGSYELTNSPTLSHLPKDTVIFNEEQTKRILKNGGISGKAYASGNATAKTLAEVMPEKAAIFERFEANLQANIDSIKMNTYDISRNVADMAKAVINNTSYNGNTVTNNINITCPGVTEAEVARNMGPLVEQAFTNIFSGMSLGANQRAMRR